MEEQVKINYDDDNDNTDIFSCVDYLELIVGLGELLLYALFMWFAWNLLIKPILELIWLVYVGIRRAGVMLWEGIKRLVKL